MTSKILFGAMAFLFAPFAAQSQPVIQPRDIPSRAGTTLAYWTAADTGDGIEVEVGQSGENRVWDLTGYQFEEIQYDTLLDPEEAPEIDSFEGANRVLRSATNDLGLNLGTGYQYEALTDSGWYMLGVMGDGGLLDLPIVYPTPQMILPMPTEYGAEWDIGVRIRFGFPPPDTLRAMLGELADLVDSIYVNINLGGFSSIDGWGIVRFSGGEVRALRQFISTGGRITISAAGRLFGRRFEEEIPGLGYEIASLYTYRWFAAGVGEIAAMTSMLGEEDPDFSLASQVRVRRVIPEMTFPQGPLAFGEVHVGNSGVGSLLFRNAGEGIGIVSRIQYSAGVAGEIECLSELPLVIEPDSSGRLRFLWSPTVERTLQGETVSLYHNDPQMESPLVMQLAGNTPGFNGVPRNTLEPGEFSIAASYPNPFNGIAMIVINASGTSQVRLTVRDLFGRQAAPTASYIISPGERTLSLDCRALPAGIYWVDAVAGGRLATTSINLVR